MKKIIFFISFLFAAALFTSCEKDEIKFEGTTWEYTAPTGEMNVFDKMTLFFKDEKNFTATVGYFDDAHTETVGGIYTYAHPTITLKFQEEDVEEKLTVTDKTTLTGTLQISGEKIIFKKK